MRPTEYWTRLADFGVLCALVLVVTAALFATWIRYGEDFTSYYAPAKVILEGQNPYDYKQIVTTVLSTTGQGGNSPFYYPLWITFPFFPLAFVPFQAGRLLWLVALLGFWAIAMRLTDRLLSNSYPARWVRWIVWIFAFLLFGWATLRAEQIAFALFFAWALCIWAIERGQNKTAATALALLLIKPNVTFLPFIALFVHAWWKDRRITYAAIVVLALLFSVSSLVTPGWWEPIVEGRLPNGWNQGLTGYEIDSRRLTTTTLDFLDYNLGIQRVPAVIIQVGIGLLAVYLVWRWRHHVLYDNLLALTFVFLITPYAMQYDYALLTPAFLWMMHQLPHSDRRKQIVVVAGLAFLASILFWEKPVTDGLWMPMTLVALLLITAPSAYREDARGQHTLVAT